MVGNLDVAAFHDDLGGSAGSSSSCSGADTRLGCTDRLNMLDNSFLSRVARGSGVPGSVDGPAGFGGGRFATRQARVERLACYRVVSRGPLG